jgi:hypothetical protein
MQLKTEMKRERVKKRKKVGNESPSASMFQNQQTANDSQKAREAYDAMLEKGKQLGFEEKAHAELLLS